MGLKQCHKPCPSHHHFYRWDNLTIPSHGGLVYGIVLTTLMGLPSGKHTKNYGKSPFFMENLTINGPCSIAMLLNYQRVTSNEQYADVK